MRTRGQLKPVEGTFGLGKGSDRQFSWNELSIIVSAQIDHVFALTMKAPLLALA
jgi:hypothetical protein